jgi:hypothetical protein
MSIPTRAHAKRGHGTRPHPKILLNFFAEIVAKARRIGKLSALGFLPNGAMGSGLLMGKEPIS